MKARHYFSISIFLILFLVIPHSALSQTPDGDVAPLGARDGTVNVGDALVALRFALGLESPTPDDSIHADVAPLDADNKPNPDGVITVGDALVILRKALGLVYFNGGVGGGGGGGTSLQEGVFLDTVVEGIEYETATQSGVTDSNGTFKYHEGETITFSIADVVLGQTMAKATMTPVDLVIGAIDETAPTVTNICRLLQSLDEDGNLNNGITISTEIRNEVANRPIDFTQSTEDFGNDPDIEALFATLNALGIFTDEGDRTLCSAEQAQSHMKITLNSSGLYPISWNGVEHYYGSSNNFLTISELLGPQGASISNIVPGTYIAKGIYDLTGSRYTTGKISLRFLGTIVTAEYGKTTEMIEYIIPDGKLRGSYAVMQEILRLESGPGTPSVGFVVGSTVHDCITLY